MSASNAIVRPSTEPHLAALPPLAPPEELQPQPIGDRGGRPYQRRLRKAVLEALPFAEDALAALAGRWLALLAPRPALGPSCPSCGRPWGHVAHQPFGECEVPPPGVLEGELAGAVGAFRRELARGPAMVARPVGDDRDVADAREAHLLAVMEEQGLDVEHACARLRISARTIAERARQDPLLAERLDRAWKRGTVKLHEVAQRAALGGSETATFRLLEARDSRYVRKTHVDVTVKDILGSRAFSEEIAPLLVRVFASAVAEVPEGVSEDERRGWAEAVAYLRRRVVEELSRG